MTSPSRLRVRVRGLVQGVGFRPFVFLLATRHRLTGWVCNDEQGVLAEVQGDACEAFLLDLRRERPPLARVDSVETRPLETRENEAAFVIRESTRSGAATVAIGPDHGPCRACLEEIFDPKARRYLYPFVNCTHCGPRFTITKSLPYDRPQTSMAGFPICADCSAEYHDPLDRRFHAQPLACPRCGPRLSMPLQEIADRLLSGQIVALKGAGGFTLACDARNVQSVATLRQRKQRDAKPFACMVANVASARLIAGVTDDEALLLQSSQRPIMLVRKRSDARLAPLIAPGLAHLGVMLPSTPLHYALFHALAGKPEGLAWLDLPLDCVLVMTSANPGGEPLVIANPEAATRLAGIADCVVTHDRDIVVRVDDSVLRVIHGAPTFIRRARGYVPEPVRLPFEVPCVLAVGGYLKTTICFTRGREAYVSQHLGDLENAATCRFFEETVEHLRRTLEVTPVAVAHDLHPDFPSTRMAPRMGLPLIAVQHHHAHLASVLAERGLRGPAVGLALDGSGHGSDGEAWGGELLLVEGSRFERLGHLRPLRLPGGDAAARAPWRMACAALHELGRAGEIVPRFGPYGATPALLEMLARGIHSPWTTSLGRWFDAACGLLGVREQSSYEGEAPMVLESLVSRPEVLPGGWRIEADTLDLLPLLGRLAGRSPEDGANVFHGTLAAALVDWALPALAAQELHQVVVGGGCAMNKVLTELLVSRFARHGIEVLFPRLVPANDGGLSLGQAWVAALRLLR